MYCVGLSGRIATEPQEICQMGAMGQKMNSHSPMSRLNYKKNARSLPCDLNALKVSVANWLQADLEFLRDRSIWCGIRIILLTFRVLILDGTFFITLELSRLRNGVGDLVRRTMPSRIFYFGDQ